MTYRLQFRRLVMLALIALFPIGGCVWGSVQYDRTLEKEKINKIESGKTTPKNILEWFGPPEVLARQGRMTWLPALEGGPEEMRKVDSSIFFTYFMKRHSISEHHIVYYYFNEGEDINGFSIPIPIGTFFVSLPATFGNLQVSELWVLVNRKTGQVEDYKFLEGTEK